MAAGPPAWMLRAMPHLHRFSRTLPDALAGLLVGVAALDAARLAVLIGPAACTVAAVVALAAGAWCGARLRRGPAPQLVRLVATAAVTVIGAGHVGGVRWGVGGLMAEAALVASVLATMAVLQGVAVRRGQPVARPSLRLIQGGVA